MVVALNIIGYSYIMIEIKKVTSLEEVASELIELSKEWFNENITNGLVANTIEDLKLPCYTAIIDNHIIGYIFGHYYNREKKSSLIPKDAKCFDVDELFVKKDYRSLGIGQKLYDALEKEVMNEAEYMTLVTSTRDYKKILHFYADELGMTFNYAELIKKI